MEEGMEGEKMNEGDGRRERIVISWMYISEGRMNIRLSASQSVSRATQEYGNSLPCLV
jgi:hypothetical protein